MRSLNVRGLNWDNARSYCLSYGGDLVSVSNKSEMDFIASKTSKAGKEYFWIGLNDRRKENVFVWSDGTPYNKSIYNNWYPKEPNNQGGEDCVELFPTQWNDESCMREKSYICERPKGKILVLNLAKYTRSYVLMVATLVILMTMAIKNKTKRKRVLFSLLAANYILVCPVPLFAIIIIIIIIG